MTTSTIERPVQADGEDILVYGRRRRRWQMDVGETCYQCGGFVNLFSQPPGHRRLCDSCRELDEGAGEVNSSHYLRCPRCRHRLAVWEGDGPSAVLEEGPHAVTCPECEYDFTMATRVTYSFCSPPLLPEVPECDCGAACPGGLSEDGWCGACQAARDEERRLEAAERAVD